MGLVQIDHVRAKPPQGFVSARQRDAAFAVNNWLKPKFALPMHYGTNPFLKGTPAEFEKALGRTDTKVFPISPGVKLEF